jgi:hypothetical protein
MKKRLSLYAITAVMLGLLVIVVPSTITPQLSLQEQQDDRQLSLPKDYNKNGGAVNADALFVSSSNALKIITVGLISGIIAVLLFQHFSKRI